jgi:hypothetical protein
MASWLILGDSNASRLGSISISTTPAYSMRTTPKLQHFWPARATFSSPTFYQTAPVKGSPNTYTASSTRWFVPKPVAARGSPKSKSSKTRKIAPPTAPSSQFLAQVSGRSPQVSAHAPDPRTILYLPRRRGALRSGRLLHPHLRLPRALPVVRLRRHLAPGLHPEAHCSARACDARGRGRSNPGRVHRHHWRRARHSRSQRAH